jgi:hypothetical protein
MSCLSIQFLAQVKVDIPKPGVGLEIYNRFNQLIYAISSSMLGQELPLLKGGTYVIASFCVRFSIEPGEYSFMADSGEHNISKAIFYDRRPKLGPITVFWNRPLLPFCGLTALETGLDMQIG